MKIKSQIFAAMLLASVACVPAIAEVKKNLLPPVQDKSLWFRYYVAGEKASEQNDVETAHRYWSAALKTLETDPHPVRQGDIFFAVRLSALEQRFTDSYPKDWSKQEGSDEQNLKGRMEQVETLRRITNINYRLIRPDNRLVSASKERYTVALQDLQKYLKENPQVAANLKRQSAPRTLANSKNTWDRRAVAQSPNAGK